MRLSSRRVAVGLTAPVLGVALASLAALPSPTNAAIAYVSANRSVSATSFGGSPDSSNSAALGPLSLNASSNGTQSSASAVITSDFLLDRVTLSGGASASDTWESSGGGAANGSAGLTVRFTLDISTPYSLIGTVSGNPGNQGGVSERLTRVTDNTVIFQGFGSEQSGILAAGTYDFVASYAAGVNGVGIGGGSVNFNRVFQVPSGGTGVIAGLGILSFSSRRRRTSGD